MKKKCSALEDHLGFWLRFVSNYVSASFERKLASHDVGVGEWVVLRHLYEVDFLSSGILAQKTGITRGAMSKLIEKLVQKNLVERKDSLHDRRFQEIKITEKGRKLLPQIALLADLNDNEFFNPLTAQQKEDLKALCKTLIAHHRWNQIPIT